MRFLRWVLPMVMVGVVLVAAPNALRPPGPVRTPIGGGAAPSSARSTYYVSPSGDDSNPGTLKRPLGTFEHALETLRAGDTLYARGGSYREAIKVRASPGRRRARVVVKNYRGEQPVVRGELWIGEPSYWTIDGINVTWAAGNPNEPMMRLYGGTHWRLQNSKIWGAHSTSGLHVDDGPRDNLGKWTVTRNCIHDTYPTNGTNQDHNVYVDDMRRSDNPRGLIARNVVFNAVNGRGIKLGPGRGSRGPVNVRIRYNTVYNSSQNISVSRNSSDIKISRNVLVKATEANLRGFRLKGLGNVARNNLAAEAPRFLLNDPGFVGVANGGGNIIRRAFRFDSIGCAAFHTSERTVYGRYGWIPRGA